MVSAGSRCHRAARRGRCASCPCRGSPTLRGSVLAAVLRKDHRNARARPEQQQRDQAEDHRRHRQLTPCGLGGGEDGQRGQGRHASSLPLPRAARCPRGRYDASPLRAPLARRRPVARIPTSAARLGCCACPPSCPSSSPCTTRRTCCPCSWSGSGPSLDAPRHVLRGGRGRRRQQGRDPGAAAALPPRLAAAAGRAAAGQRRAPGGDLGRPRARPGRLRRHPRRRPAGPARGHPRDAGGGPARRGRRRLRRARRPLDRLGVQARLGPGLLPADPAVSRHRPRRPTPATSG